MKELRTLLIRRKKVSLGVWRLLALVRDTKLWLEESTRETKKSYSISERSASDWVLAWLSTTLEPRWL